MCQEWSSKIAQKKKKKKVVLETNHSHLKSTIIHFLGFFTIKGNAERNFAHWSRRTEHQLDWWSCKVKYFEHLLSLKCTPGDNLNPVLGLLYLLYLTLTHSNGKKLIVSFT